MEVDSTPILEEDVQMFSSEAQLNTSMRGQVFILSPLHG